MSTEYNYNAYKIVKINIFKFTTTFKLKKLLMKYTVRRYFYMNSTTTYLGITELVKLCLTFRHRASCILGQAFRYSPEKAFYTFNQQIYFII